MSTRSCRLAAGATAVTAVAGSIAILAPAAHAATSYPTSLTISAPTTVAYSHAATIRGVLKLSGTPFGLAGEKVELRERPTSSAPWTVIATKKTGNTGQVTFAAAPKRRAQFDLFHPADGFTTASTSPTRTIAVSYDVVASLGSKSVAPGKSDTVKVAVTPSASGATVALQELKSGTWTTIKTRALNGTSATTFTFSAPSTSGKYKYRIVKAAGNGYRAGSSGTLTLTVS